MVHSSVEQRHGFSYAEGLITAVSFGGFLIILGIVFALTPGTWQAVTNFFNDLTLKAYPFGSPGSTISVLTPAHPDVHASFYNAVMGFCFGIGALQIIILILRLIVHSHIGKISETIGNLVFWIGAAFSVDAFLLAGTLTGWFQFWAVLLLILGVSLIARGLVYLFRRHPVK